MENAYATELSSMSEVNTALQLSMDGYEQDAAEAARKLQEANDEKAALLKWLEDKIKLQVQQAELCNKKGQGSLAKFRETIRYTPKHCCF